MRATLRVALGVEILRCMMGSLVPYRGTRPLFTRATTDAVCEFLSMNCHILTLRMVFILLLVGLATKPKESQLPLCCNPSGGSLGAADTC